MKVQPISTKRFFSCEKLGQNKINSIKISNDTSSEDIFVSSEKEVNQYRNAIPFLGVSAKGVVKQRGLLMHITSLPAHRSFCGQFGDIQTSKFIQWLKKAKQTHWIMNPLNALEDNLCPYSSVGRFSRNKFIVNLNKLTSKDYGEILKEEELPDDITPNSFTYQMLEGQKNPRFKKAFERFKLLDEASPIKKEFGKFVEKNEKLWLDSYANYDALARLYGQDWGKWDVRLQIAPEYSERFGVPLEDRISNVLSKKITNFSEEQYKDSVNLYKFEQFLYEKQFREFVDELNSNGIRLIMDLPIGVSPKGVDTWGKKKIFLLDNNYNPIKISGCPPEGAHHNTQAWGHALYNYDSPEFWKYQEDSLRQLLETADLRLDHFVGYINRAEIPTSYTKDDGTVLYGDDIFKSVEDGGMGKNFFKKEWIENIDKKISPKGESVFQLFVRIAKEVGKKPEDTYILESFGPLAKTRAYKNFEKKYGRDFITQRIPIAMGMAESNKKLRKLNSFSQSSIVQNLAYLTGNHDLPSLREFIDKLLGKSFDGKNLNKMAREEFKEFCKNELKLNDEEIKNSKTVWENAMKWHYSQNVKQVQTTLQDALGIYWRPNIPGYWEGMMDKFLMLPSKEALTNYWSRVFPKDFLERDNISGINPGYKKAADNFVKMMEDLYS